MSDVEYIAPKRPVPPAKLVTTLADGTHVKVRIPRMRACDEKNDKGKPCHGHLKRWYHLTDEAAQKFGPHAEIYRCEHCRTLYLPNPEEQARTRTMSW